MTKFQRIEEGKFYFYNRTPYKCVTATPGMTRIVPINKVSVYEPALGIGEWVSDLTFLEPVSDEVLRSYREERAIGDGPARRGRPKGVKNKKKNLADMSLAEARELVKKSGHRGRPKGSKNKVKKGKK